MKHFYWALGLLSFFSAGCSGQSKGTGKAPNNDTTYQVTSNMKGDTINIKTIVNGKSNGPFRSYYDDGKLWYTSNYVDGKVNGEAYLYTHEGDIAVKEIWKDNTLWESIVFWQAIPYTDRNEKFYFLSKEGIQTVKNGRYIYDFGPNPPDGLVVPKYENGRETFYVYKNGELELYPLPDKK